jgi:hypothetical protein
MYRIQPDPERIDDDWVCVTFKRLGADPDTVTEKRKLRRADYEKAILGTWIDARGLVLGLGGTNWSENEVFGLLPCG